MRLLRSFIALLLISCLAVDPALTAALNSPIPQVISGREGIFTRQALAAHFVSIQGYANQARIKISQRIRPSEVSDPRSLNLQQSSDTGGSGPRASLLKPVGAGWGPEFAPLDRLHPSRGDPLEQRLEQRLNFLIGITTQTIRLPAGGGASCAADF